MGIILIAPDLDKLNTIAVCPVKFVHMLNSTKVISKIDMGLNTLFLYTQNKSLTFKDYTTILRTI